MCECDFVTASPCESGAADQKDIVMLRCDSVFEPKQNSEAATGTLAERHEQFLRPEACESVQVKFFNYVLRSIFD